MRNRFPEFSNASAPQPPPRVQAMVLDSHERAALQKRLAQLDGQLSRLRRQSPLLADQAERGISILEEIRQLVALLYDGYESPSVVDAPE